METLDQPDTPRMEVVQQSPVHDDDEPSTSQPPGHRKRRLWFVLAGCLVAALLAAGGAYWLLAHKSKAATQQTQTTAQDQQTTQPVPDTTDTSAGTPGTYMSNGSDLNLTFTYPSDWTVTPASGDNASDQPIVVTSPLTSMASASGNMVTGKVVVSIRPGSSEISELSAGMATAALASVQIAYTKPTAHQHQYPYITFIHLKGGQNPGGAFEEVMITGVNQFAKGQGITGFSLGQLDPIVTASFYQCSAQTCTDTGASPLSITSSTWQNDDPFKQAQALFESLQFN